MTIRLIRDVIGYCIASFPSIVLAAIDNPPREDLDFFAEHLVESSLDARYFALPWPDSTAPGDKWRPFVSIGGWRSRQGKGRDAYHWRGACLERENQLQLARSLRSL